ncbi:MAG: helix-turn-helix transcriptional regulator [Pseudomonadota bacterium]|nr:helix-turn-helix transcriptional regulator [Pseudomonadota bacterium]MDE3037391.1 helix-turn-helix transcriptional regulator [Pseudomonadota bacterium]
MAKSYKNKLGAFLAQGLAEKGLSQEDFAESSEIGRATLSRILRQGASPNNSTTLSLVNGLNKIGIPVNAAAIKQMAVMQPHEEIQQMPPTPLTAVNIAEILSKKFGQISTGTELSDEDLELNAKALGIAQVKFDKRAEIQKKDPSGKLQQAREFLNTVMSLQNDGYINLAKKLLADEYRSLGKYDDNHLGHQNLADRMAEEDFTILQDARASARIGSLNVKKSRDVSSDKVDKADESNVTGFEFGG